MKRKKAKWPLEVDGIKYPRDEVIRIIRESAEITAAVREAVRGMEKSIVESKTQEESPPPENPTTDVPQ